MNHLYTNAYISVYIRKDMSGTVIRPRLYWRYKKDGKWTWRAASPQFIEAIKDTLDIYGIEMDHPLFLEEEE